MYIYIAACLYGVLLESLLLEVTRLYSDRDESLVRILYRFVLLLVC